jgi:Domain of unknown function (DUF4465)
MIHTKLRASALAGAVALCLYSNATAAAVIDFESVILPATGYQNGSQAGDNFTISGATFVNNYNPALGDFWDGFAFSNATDVTTPGFGNQYSAIAGKGAGGSANYAISYSASTITLAGVIDFSGLSAQLTNTSYAALSMQNGDAFAKKFGGLTGNDPDFFLLTIKGFLGAAQTAGMVEFYLADFRATNNVNDYIIKQWTTVDFSALGLADRLSFSLSSSDNGNFGINTPAYFALDNLVIPEPSSWLLLIVSGLGMLAFRKR